jgi:hypothetical protein
MLSTRSAHTLLTQAASSAGLLTLARALGFRDPPHRLSRRTTRALGVPETLRTTRVTKGRDLATLIVEQVRPDDWRATLRALASYLDRLTDPRRYLLILQCSHDGPLVLACWLSSARGPRLAVLTTSPTTVLDSDAQTVAALAASLHPDPTHTILRWHDLLGRHAIGARFFRALDRHVADIAAAWPDRVHADDRRTLALIHVARLLFLKFLETKGWLDHDRAFLARHAERTLATNGSLWAGLIAPLTFGTLNTPPTQRAAAPRAFGAVPFLNGGLFACTPIERRCRRPAISNALLAPLILDTLARYRFTAREDTSSWSEAAIDPDLLGRTFEALMDTTQRRGSGTFYTPAALGTQLVDDALTASLGPLAVVRDEAAAAPGDRDADALRAQLATFRALDPACGSGSLLVNTLETLASLHARLGDRRPIHEIRRDVLTRSIFGTDIAPMAVWLCELRLWLSIVIDDETSHPSNIAPLPNLEHHIRLGDALGSDAFGATPAFPSRRIAALRARYARSAGARKKIAAARIDAAERTAAIQLTTHTLRALDAERAQLLQLARARTLFGTRQGLSGAQRRRLATVRTLIRQSRRTLRRLDDGGATDFDFRTHFADAASAGGFDLVIGNPPWVRSHHLDDATRATLRTRFAAVTRHATGSQAFGVQTDLAIAFTHRGVELTKPGGILAFLVPAKLWRSVAAGALRQHLLQHGRPLLLRDQSHTNGGFAAAVYPSAIVVQRRDHPCTTSEHPMTDGTTTCHTTDAAGTAHAFAIATRQLTADGVPGAPWRVIPDAVRHAADILHTAGHRWNDSILPPPSLGVKTGCNDAFLLAADAVPAALRPFTRPVLRGDHVRPWSAPRPPSAIVVPCDRAGTMLPSLPAPLARHFAPHQRELQARTDLRPREPWWSLFRTELLASTGWRVIWADIGRTLRATILPPGAPAVPLNTCYGVRLHDPVDAHALAALLNAPTTTAWLSLVAEPARGGYHRFMGWTVLALPLPDWRRARECLAPVAARARRGEAVTASALHQATLEAYGVTHDHVAPLLAWCNSALRAERRVTPHRAAS